MASPLHVKEVILVSMHIREMSNFIILYYTKQRCASNFVIIMWLI